MRTYADDNQCTMPDSGKEGVEGVEGAMYPNKTQISPTKSRAGAFGKK